MLSMTTRPWIDADGPFAVATTDDRMVEDDGAGNIWHRTGAGGRAQVQRSAEDQAEADAETASREERRARAEDLADKVSASLEDEKAGALTFGTTDRDRAAKRLLRGVKFLLTGVAEAGE
jgi:lysozyme family protein